MQAIVASGLGFNPRMEVADRKQPTVGEDDVLVKVHASSVNPKDWKLNFRLGQLSTPLGRRFLPPVFGDDLAGEVVAVGPKVKAFAEGERVYGMDMRLHTVALAEYAVIRERRIAKMPSNMSFAEAAAMPLAAQTALQGLRKGKAHKGSSVLIIGASGGVGTYAVQIARIMGCRITAVCSGRNADMVKELGAHEVIDYTQGDFRQTAGPFDLVFDVTSYETPRSCRALRKPDGYFISTMGNGRSMWSTTLSVGQNASLVVVESYTSDLESLANWVDEGKLYSVIDQTRLIWPCRDVYHGSGRKRSRRRRH